MKKFTLIELIVVIAVLGILAAIVLPNISNIQGKATTTAISSNVKNLQTVVDMYKLDHHNDIPAEQRPTRYIPVEIHYDKLIPEYLRNLPKTKEATYWLDVHGKVWGSTISPPTNVSTSEAGVVSWDEVDGAVKYIVFQVNESTATGSIYDKELILVEETTETTYNGKSNTAYVVSAVDKEGFQTVPSGIGYVGELNNNPIAVISMNPNTTITTETKITWDYLLSTDPDGDPIEHTEWENKFEQYQEGTQTVRLRVQDSKGAWSQWVEKTFIVSKAPVAQTVTWNPADKGNIVALSNNNLTAYHNNYQGSNIRASVGKTTGKWYWEIKLDMKEYYSAFNAGVAYKEKPISTYIYPTFGGSGFLDRFIYNEAVTGDVLGFKLNMDTHTLEVYKNNILHKTITGFTGTVYPIVGEDNNNGTAQYTANFGGTSFKYQPESEFKPYNLSE